MQNEFKERILQYLVGDYSTETGNNNLIVGPGASIGSTNVIDEINDINGTILGKTNSQDGQFTIIYGKHSNSKGFIALCENNLKFIQLFTKYEGGTDLPVIKYLHSAEDGTFYGISENNSNNYLLMLNNFTLTLTGTYSVKFKQSYLLDGDLQNAHFEIYGSKVFKKPETGQYIFIVPLTYTTNPDTINQIIVSFFTINFGEENEWQHNTYNVLLSLDYGANNPEQVRSFDTYASWIGDDYVVKISGKNLAGTQLTEYKLNNDTTLITETHTISTIGTITMGKGNLIIKDYNYTYYGFIGTNNYYVYRESTSDIEEIAAVSKYQPGGYAENFYMTISNGKIVYCCYTTYDDWTFLGMIDGNINYSISTEYIMYSLSDGTIFNVSNIYNLYTLSYADNTDFGSMNNFIYNSNNYNGQDYQDYNSMVPNSGVLYNNNSIIFARNLYNKIINANTTESIIEIPNAYLNDTTITKEQLYSQTNSLLNEETQQINKNIYEKLYINFFNTITMSNQNNPNDIIYNIQGATRLNQSISNNNHYDNVKIGRIVVNYEDETNYVINNFTLSNNSTTSYTISFKVYVEKAINNIQIQSFDGNTTYQTIQPNLEIGKLYELTQDVSII